MSIEIVPIDESHIEGFRATLDSVARERMYLAQIEAPPVEKVRDFVINGINDDVSQFVAIDGPLVVGWCDILPAWAHAVRHRGTLGIGVIASYRSRGIGKRLLVACLAKARSNGISRVELEVRAGNMAAIQLYKKLGFVHEVTLRHAMLLDGRYYDAVQMSLVYES